MSIVPYRNRNRNKAFSRQGFLLTTRFLKARPGRKLRHHGKLGKLEIVAKLSFKMLVIFLSLRISSMLSHLVYEKCI